MKPILGIVLLLTVLSIGAGYIYGPQTPAGSITPEATSNSMPSIWQPHYTPPGTPVWTDLSLSPNPVVIVQECPTALSIGFTYKTSLQGMHTYYLEKSKDFVNWQIVYSQDSPQTNSWPANLIVDENPDPNYVFYRVGVQ